MDMQSILKQLSLKEKAALISGADFWHSADLSRFGLPALTFSDGPHGLRFQADQADHLGFFKSNEAVCFPTASALANSWDPLLAYLTGKSLSKQAAAAGVDVLLGPGLNLIDNPKCGRSFEYYSEDPYLSGVMAGNFALGIERRVSACLKHFALNRQETNRQSVDEICDLETFMNLYVPGFKKAIELARPGWIMSSYNKINGIYANENKVLLQDILRGQLHFDGAVVSDWGGGNDCVAGIEAGCSIEMPSTFGQTPALIEKAVLQGSLKESDLDQRVLEVLKAMEKSLRKRKVAALGDSKRAVQSGIKAAYEAACQSMVLLKNDHQILPLDPEKKILFLGPFDNDFPMQGGGSSKVETAPLKPFSELLKESGFENSIYIPAYSRRGMMNLRTFMEVEDALLKCDLVVLLLCYPEQETLEGVDRKYYDVLMPAKKLVQMASGRHKPIVLADAISGPKSLESLEAAEGLIHMGLCGQQAREALLDILKGKVNPSGKLAQSWAASWQEYPSSENYPATGPQSRRNVSAPSYSWFASQSISPVYPFGYGLSYSRFKISRIQKEGHGISMVLENTSDVDGSEVIQLYVSQDDSSLPLLKGFQKFFVKGHEKQKVFIPLDPEAFCTWSLKDHRYAARSGRWKVQVSTNGLEAVRGIVFFDVQEEPNDEPIHLIEWPKDSAPIQQWDLNLTSPIKTMTKSRNPAIRTATKILVASADASLKLRTPKTILLAMKDLPLKSLMKTSSQYVDQETALKILETAQNPKARSFAELIGYLRSRKPNKR